MTSRKLYERILSADPPLILDVRNQDEHAGWRIEGPHPLEMINIPYFEFIEAEDRAVGEVTRWRAGASRPRTSRTG